MILGRRASGRRRCCYWCLSSSLSFLLRRHEQRGRGLYGAETGLRPVLQPLVRREVPEGRRRRRRRRERRGALPPALQALPALRPESDQREGDPHRRAGVHGPQQREVRKLFLTSGVAGKGFFERWQTVKDCGTDDELKPKDLPPLESRPPYLRVYRQLGKGFRFSTECIFNCIIRERYRDDV